MPSWEWRARAKRAFLEEDTATAAGYMQRAEQEAQNSPNPPKDWRACAYIWVWRGDAGRARECWCKAANNPIQVNNNIKVRNTIKLARGWLRVFHDADRAIQCINGLQPAEVQNAKRVTNLLRHATGWLRTLFGDDAEAQRFFGVLQPADFENAIEYASVWLSLRPDPEAAKQHFEALQPADFTNAVEHARIWWEFFNDREKAKACLTTAEGLAKTFNHHLNCATAWAELLGDKRRAETCLRKAEDLAGDGAPEWLKCADMWSRKLNNDHEAQRCRDEVARLEFKREARAAAVAGNVNHLAEVFRRYINRLNNAEGARNCLREAQQVCNQPADYVAFAEAWIQCKCEEDARQCLLSGQRRLSEQGVESSIADWCHFAGQWLTLCNGVQARDCLQQTEQRRHSAGDWIDCARLWRRINDIPHVERCLKQAQRWRALSDLLQCARAWKELADNPNRTRRCLELAEAQAARTSNTGMWLDVGQHWRELLDDLEAARRCFRQAEQVADGPCDLLDCARAWQCINEYATERIRCLHRAKTFCKTAADWRELATRCRNLLGDEVEAQHCLEQAARLED